MITIEQEKKEAEINALEILLAQTDYMSLKHSEGAMTDEDFAEIKELRQSWRVRINELQQELSITTIMNYS